MAGSIKGIIVEIGGDTSGLQKALSKVNSATSSLSKELRGVNSLLKLDPKNTELLTQKQELLNKQIQETSQELELLKKHQQDVSKSGQELTEENQKKYRNLQREIINTENKLKDLKVEASNWTTAGRAIEAYGTKIQNLGNKIDSIGNKLTTRLTLPLVALGVAGVQSAASQEAAMQQVELIYGDASDAIKNFAENTAISFNMSKQDAYKYSQIYGNLIQSITDDEEENALYTQQLLKASSVIASATGRTMEDVMDRIRSGLLGNTEAIEDLGVNVNVSLLESTDAFRKFAGDKSWEQLDFQTQQQIRLFGILEQTTKKYGDEVNKNTSSDIQRLTAKFKNLTSDLSKKLLPIADKLIDKAEDFLDRLEDLDDEQLDNIINIGLMVAAVGPLIKILGTVISAVGGAAKGIGLFSQAIAVATNKTTSNVTSVNNLAKALSALTSPVGLLITAFAGITTAAVIYEKHQQELLGNSTEIKKAIDEEIETRNKLIETQNNNISNNLSEISRNQELYDELKTITDENGKIKKGYENRANYITNQLSEALGIEINLNNGVIDSYKKIQDEIDKTILKKKAETIVNGQEETYNNALEKRAEAYDTLNQLEENYQDLVKQYGVNTYDVRAKQAMASLQNQLNEQRKLIEGYNSDIAKYEHNYSLLLENTTDSLNEVIRNSEIGISKLTDDTYDGITTQINYYSQLVKDYKRLKQEQLDAGNEYNAQAYADQEESNKKQLEQLAAQLSEITTTTNINEPIIQAAWKEIAESSSDSFFEIIEKMPSNMQQELLSIAGVIKNDSSTRSSASSLAIDISDTFDLGISSTVDDTNSTLNNVSKAIDKNTSVEKSMENLARDAERGFNNNVNGTKWGKDLTKEMSNGMTSGQSKSWIQNAASTVAGWISNFLHFSLPDEGPLSDMDQSMPDMIDLMVKGIYGNEHKLIEAANKLAKDLNDKLMLTKNSSVANFERMQNGIISKTIDNTKTIITTPQVVFNVQELDEAKLEQCFNYINRKFGAQY